MITATDLADVAADNPWPAVVVVLGLFALIGFIVWVTGRD